MSVTQELVIGFSPVYGIGTRAPFLKQYRYFTNHCIFILLIYYIFVCTITLLLLISFHTLNANVFSNETFTHLEIFDQISSGSIDLFFLQHPPLQNHCDPWNVESLLLLFPHFTALMCYSWPHLFDINHP